MEHPAVDDGVERHRQLAEVEDVSDQEAHGDAPFGGLGAGGVDGKLRDIDARHVGAIRRGEQRLLAGPATRVQEPAGQQALLGQADERGLRPPDVPRRFLVTLVRAIPFTHSHAPCPALAVSCITYTTYQEARMRLNSKGQVTIPAAIRERHGLHEGDEVDVIEDGNTLRIVRVEASPSRGERLVRRMRGRATTGMTTDQLLELLRAE
jgi:AbrB family looped-hinge helix DNA binding protein